MANNIRMAKSANSWVLSDLVSYNISLEEQDYRTFFNLPEGEGLPVLPDSLTELLAHEGLEFHLQEFGHQVI